MKGSKEAEKRVVAILAPEEALGITQWGLREKEIETINVSSEEEETEETEETEEEEEEGEEEEGETPHPEMEEVKVEDEQQEMRSVKSRKVLSILRYEVGKYETESGISIREDGGWVRQEFLNSIWQD